MEQRITFRLSTEEFFAIQDMAQETGRTVAALVRILVLEGLNDVRRRSALVLPMFPDMVDEIQRG